MLIDISRPIHSGMVVYPNNPAISLTQIQRAEEGKSALSLLSIGSHTGTHIDAPAHIGLSGGIEQYTLDQYIGDAEVIEIDSSVRVIHAADLPPTHSSRVLIKTRNSEGDVNVFDEDFTALAEDAAQELVSRGVRLVGIDALSIKKKGVRDSVHEIFLSNAVVIVEGLWFANVLAGLYTLMCLPLLLPGVDGAPTRAVLARKGDV